ncbi:MAG: family 10 glycosylhydrolase [Fischerella sp. CENA71]|nr:family 10 glycosylhydrolase [Fischerella sp. CENA71]
MLDKKIRKNQLKNIKTTRLYIFKIKLIFLLYNIFAIAPAIAATSEEPVFSIVHTQENANQWAGIENRLQAIGAKYCVISLDSVKSAADWGDRPVLFLPNVENISPVQAIALEEWMRNGGRLIASGPVGNSSAPGVRQLLQSLLGGYWGFSLNSPQKLQPSSIITRDFDNQNDLLGTVRGGVMVPNAMASQAGAVWDAQDKLPAVLTTERSTLLGWRWGVDAASGVQTDTAWLKAALNRHLKKFSIFINKVPGGSSNCSTSVIATTSPTPNTVPTLPDAPWRVSTLLPKSPTPTSPPPQITATATQPRPLPNITFPRSDEAIDQLEQRVRLDVEPKSNAPISRNEAIALQQQLENLIGRVESAHLAAAVQNGNSPVVKVQQVEFASVKSGAPVQNTEQAIAQAREILKNLPQLIAQKQYAQARSNWLMAKSSLWQQFPVDQRLAQPEIRAIWLDRGTIVRAGSEKGLAKIFDRLAQAGFNTVFFETVNSSYTIYPSQVAPQQNPLIRGWDPLAAGVKLAHQRGMELHAWVWTFAAGNQRHNQILNLNRNYPGPVLAAHPDWANYDQRGQMIPQGQGKPFFDQANPQVRQYLQRLYEEIVTRYQVDGLQLDYIRYPFQDPSAGRTYGYGKAARAKFQQLTGVDPINISPSQRELWQKWTEFRTQQVNSFVAELSKNLRAKRPNLILSVAVFPLPEQERIQKIQQNWEVWARQGDVDVIIPMTYAQDTLRFERLAQPWIASAKLGSTLLVPGIRLLSLPTVGAFDQIQLVRDLPISGYALFAADNFNNELYKVFSRTQGRIQGTQKEPIPSRQPFAAAAARYNALVGEWKFVSQNDELKLSAIAISDFNTQAEVLQSALNQLAAEPSASKFRLAKATLVRFQSQFRVWMRSQSVNEPYQVKAWENRLVAIEKLLRYGEHTTGI